MQAATIDCPPDATPCLIKRQVAKALVSELTEQARAASGHRDDNVLLPRVHATMALLQCCLVNLSEQSRRWGPLLRHLPAIIAHVSALVMLLLHAPPNATQQRAFAPAAALATRAFAAREDLGAGVAGEQRGGSDMGGLAARWQVCVLAARLIALALRRSEAVTLDTRGVQCALQVAVSLVSAVAAAGFSVPAAAGEIGAGAETAAPHALDGFGSGVREMTIGGGLEDKVVGEVDNWLQRQALAAGAVCRGCIVIEAVSDVLYSLVARRPQVCR